MVPGGKDSMLTQNFRSENIKIVPQLMPLFRLNIVFRLLLVHSLIAIFHDYLKSPLVKLAPPDFGKVLSFVTFQLYFLKVTVSITIAQRCELK